MDNGILILKVLMMAWLIVDMYFISAIIEALLDILKIKNQLVRWFITKPFSCLKCSAFWVGLIMTGNIWMAIISSIVMDQFDRHFNTIKL